MSTILPQRISSGDARTIWLHSIFSPMAFSPHYAQTDQVAVVPRRWAQAYFRFSEDVTCSWMEQQDILLRRRASQRYMDNVRNEHVLVLWLTAHHKAAIRRLYWPLDVAKAARDDVPS